MLLLDGWILYKYVNISVYYFKSSNLFTDIIKTLGVMDVSEPL